MPEDITFWRPTTVDVTTAPPLDLGGLAGGFLGGLGAGRQFVDSIKDEQAAKKAKKVLGYDPRDRGMERVRPRSETTPTLFERALGGFAGGILEGRAAQQLRSDPMGALKKKLHEQTVQMNELEIGEALIRRDEAIAGRAAAGEFNLMVQDAIKNGLANDPQTQSSILGWLAGHPEAANLPSVKQQLQLFNSSRQLLEERQKQIESSFPNQLQQFEQLRSHLQPGESAAVGDLRVSKGSSNGFAPPMIERKLQLYEEALRTGDKAGIRAYEQDLKLNSLSPEDKARFEAEIDALERDPSFAIKPQEYLQKRLEIIRRYFGEAMQSGQTEATLEYKHDSPRGKRLVPIPDAPR